MELHCTLVDHRTVAIESFFTNGFRSKITKMDGIFYSDKTPFELINLACMRYASTLEGRIQAVTQVLHFRKPPFFIIPYDLGVFPTTSPKNPNCVWIFSRQFHIVEVSKGISRLDFGNDIHLGKCLCPHAKTAATKATYGHKLLPQYPRRKQVYVFTHRKNPRHMKLQKQLGSCTRIKNNQSNRISLHFLWGDS